MTPRDLIPGRPEPLAILFLYTLAAALIRAAFTSPYGWLFTIGAFAAAAGFLAVPWVHAARLRAALAGLVAFVLIGQTFFLFGLGAYTVALVWVAVFWAVLLTLTRDQDQNFRQKLRRRK